jgi:hypothetical protein
MHRNQYTDAPKIELPEVVDAKTLAGLLDLNGRTVRKLAERKILIRSGVGKYQLKGSILGYIEHARRPPPITWGELMFGSGKNE